jgi:hypothetical protein
VPDGEIAQGEYSIDSGGSINFGSVFFDIRPEPCRERARNKQTIPSATSFAAIGPIG